MNKEELIEYIQTFFITIFFIILAIAAMVAYSQMQADKPIPEKKAQEYKENQINVLLEEYKYKIKSEPLNYLWYVKLGLIYEQIGDINLAEEQYKNAVEKVPFGNFNPTFLLAQLYVEKGEIEKGLHLVSDIKEYPDQNLIASKAAFYALAGDAYMKKQNYKMAVAEYRNSIYYQDKTKKYKGKKVINDLSQAYVKLSDQYLKEGDLDKATSTLDEGRRIVNTPEVLYHLGLIYSITDKENALPLFQKVEILDPAVIDYNVYSNLLTSLIKDSTENSDTSKAQSYQEKLKLINRFRETSIVRPGDFIIEDVGMKYHPQFFSSKDYVSLDFVIRNNTALDVTKLFLQIKVYNNGQLVNTMENKIATPMTSLKSGRTTKQIHIKLRVHEKHETNVSNDITVVLAVKKNERLKRVQLGKIIIPKNVN